MNMVIASEEILLIIAMCAIIICTTAGYFVGKRDGKLEK